MRLKIAIAEIAKSYPKIKKETIENIVTFSYKAGYDTGREEERNKGNYYYNNGSNALYKDYVDNEKYPLDDDYNVILYSNKDFSIILDEDGCYKVTGYGNKVYPAILLDNRYIDYASEHGCEWKLDFNKNDKTFTEDEDDCECDWSNRLQAETVIADGRQYVWKQLKNGDEVYVTKGGGTLREANLYYEDKDSGQTKKFRVGFVKVK